MCSGPVVYVLLSTSAWQWLQLMMYLGYAEATPLCESLGKDLDQDQKKTPWDVGSIDTIKEQKCSFQIKDSVY